MKTAFLTLITCFGFCCAQAQLTPFELSKDKNYTATYHEVIAYYKKLNKLYPEQMKTIDYGMTDIGYPLTLVVLSRDKVFDPKLIKKQNKRVLLINNGIHPGEPEGIDASMMFARDLLKKNALPKNVVICIVALYNIDGSLNRGTSRPNQNGPISYGFRGNYRNLDLNRDFIKADSRNTLALEQIINTWNPEIFLDNHTSDGADYQYVMTLIETQKDKQNPILAEYTSKTLSPELYRRMKKSGYEMIPYVEGGRGGGIDSGIVSYLETPRYATGYTSQHNIISYITETHMLKSFDKRVYSTYDFMQALVDINERDAKLIGELKRKADDDVSKQKTFAMNWQVDRTKVDTITFKGYTSAYKPSDVSGLRRQYYDETKPWTKVIKYYDNYKATETIEKPLAYVIPQAWGKIIDLYKLNNVVMHKLAHDTTLDVQMYYIADLPAPRLYEGHYLHSGIKTTPVDRKIKFFKGDYVVYTNQPLNRYIVETLEPTGVDSFFAWNFFDSIFDEKESFSGYVFEDIAADLLKKDPALKKMLDDEKAKNPQTANNAQAQLTFIYHNSAYYEKTTHRYPVGRLLADAKLDFQK